MLTKKIIAIFAVSALACCAFTGCGTSGDSSGSSSQQESSAAEESSEEESSQEESSEEEASQEESSEEDAEFAFEIANTSISADYNGASVLVVEYNFTNNSDKATSFSLACQDTAFQGGVECDSTVIGCDAVDAQEQLNDIQPGTTYTVHVGYHLQDTTSPVDIVITDLLGLNTLVEETITL